MFQKIFLTKVNSSSRRRMADFQDDFTHIGVSIDYTRRAGDREEDLNEAEYKDIDDMEGNSEEE